MNIFSPNHFEYTPPCRSSNFDEHKYDHVITIISLILALTRILQWDAPWWVPCSVELNRLCTIATKIMYWIIYLCHNRRKRANLAFQVQNRPKITLWCSHTHLCSPTCNKIIHKFFRIFYKWQCKFRVQYIMMSPLKCLFTLLVEI